MNEEEKIDTSSSESVEPQKDGTQATEVGEQRSQGAQSPREEQPSSTESNKIRRATGPRTPAGKRRSRLNALESGVFSSIVLVRGESADEYNSLRKGWFKAMRPQGAPECERVEHLVRIDWEKRRITKALYGQMVNIVENESATHCLEDVLKRWRFPFEGGDSGTILKCDSNQIFLQQAKELCVKCRDILLDRGFEGQGVSRLFREFYGVQVDEDVPSSYLRLFYEYAGRAQDHLAEGDEENAMELLSEIADIYGDEIRELEFLLNMEQDPELKARESVTAFHPTPEFVEGLMRREAHLSREYDRNLNQLEHLMRLSKGLPGLPTLKVEVNR